MKRMILLFSAPLLLLAAAANVHAKTTTLAVVMTNDPANNQIKVYDAVSGNLLQTLSTNGKGGASGNARAIRESGGTLLAAVNNGSNNVAIFEWFGDNNLGFERTVSTTSAPVSIDFANNHMYVAGATSVDSFVMFGTSVGWMDGTTGLTLFGGGVPPSGSTAQVGALNNNTLLVTLKTDPIPGTVDVVALNSNGAIAGTLPTAVSAPAGTLTPFGFSVYPDSTALITLAHSNQVGLFRNGGFTDVITPGQIANCWTTTDGKYVFTANTGSLTISRLVGTGNNIFVDSEVTAKIATGLAPADIDAAGGILGILSGGSFLSLYTYNDYGELAASGAPINIGASAASGVAIMPPPY